MKVTVRIGVFETNSSSVHTLTFSRNGMEKCRLKLDKNGKIHTHYGSFDKSGGAYTQAEKLSYLVSCLYYLKERGDGDYLFDKLSEYLKEYVPNCTGLVVDPKRVKDSYYNEPSPYIDHQSIPEGEWDLIVNMYEKDDVLNFLFNKNISVKFTTD